MSTNYLSIISKLLQSGGDLQSILGLNVTLVETSNQYLKMISIYSVTLTPFSDNNNYVTRTLITLVTVLDFIFILIFIYIK